MPDPRHAPYDPFAPDVLASPFDAYRELRERCPVHHHDGFGERGFYTLARHDEQSLRECAYLEQRFSPGQCGLPQDSSLVRSHSRL